jgi:hypothetical protein
LKGEHIYVVHPRDYSSRINTLYRVYFDIAEEEYVSCIDTEVKANCIADEYEKSKLTSNASAHAIKAIVFASLCVESAINDYAGTQLGDKYSEKHLANLDVVSKWVVIPNLVCGRSIDKSGPAFKALTKLVKARNKLVHNRSKEFDPTVPNFVESLEKNKINFKDDFENSLKALYLLCMEMDFVVGQLHNPIKTLDSAFSPCLEIPEQVKDMFNNCKSIVLKQYS